MEKDHQQEMARNMTPAPRTPTCNHFALERKKAGASAKFASSFVPDPYVSDYDRIKTNNKVGKERWMGDAFLTASGSRKVCAIIQTPQECNRASLLPSCLLCGKLIVTGKGYQIRFDTIYAVLV